ncbi:MAG: DNA polymerase III subunit gamma/tau [Salinarimonas sp.]|nr:DNA polymerase III subunit gamma/tau [Salinarimonas sp.]
MNEFEPGVTESSGEAEPALAGLEPPRRADSAGYRVLARKYRPRDFDDLIGQEAMVRTLSNAFRTGRIPQAWMLTGVRGVGKTTTARILARGLNYDRPGHEDGPTIDLAESGEHCEAIIEGRHIDVMEIDAASNNSVENVRQINDAVRYSPVTARYKVYIIDEVHMLSGGAFNAFLKTLEEPPPHAKFIFATTDIHKVPVTILSRCQRFDLRRVGVDQLVAHLTRICGLEQVEADPEALKAIARAAEGSVRDSLSLLDQAISHGAGTVTPDTVRDMLGLADRAKVIDLFEAVMRGDIVQSFALLADQYGSGADPAAILRELAGFTHLVTRLKLVPEAADDPALTEAERKRGAALAQDLSVRVLSRNWQMLLKGIGEVESASRPIAAAEMVLVRLAHVSDLPTPDEALRMLRDGAGSGAQGGGAQGGQLQGGSGQGAGAHGGPAIGDPAIGDPAHAGDVSSAPVSTPQAGTDPGATRMAAGDHAAPQIQRAPQTDQAEPAPAARPALSAVPASSPAERDAATRAVAARPESAPAAGLHLARFEDLVALAEEKRDIVVKAALERDVRLVHFEDGQLEFALAEGARRDLASELIRKLAEWTGRRWVVALSSQPGEATLREQAEAADRERRRGAADHPLVRSVLDTFPGARIVDVRERAGAEGDLPDPGLAETPPPPPDDDDGAEDEDDDALL